MSRNVSMLFAGIITIGIITALTLPGRKTAQNVTAAGKAGQGLLGTAITGKG